MKIEWLPANEDVELYVKRPSPAADYLPKWMRQMPMFDGKKPRIEGGKVVNATPSACAAFSDALNSGYILETWTDIHIQQGVHGIEYNFAIGPDPMGLRQKSHVPMGEGFIPFECVWRAPWAPKLPKGYSVLVTHPHNRFDLPFQTLSGVIDSDVYFHNEFGNIPFYVKEGFAGVIPAGTPIIQYLPFKRDDWKASQGKFNLKEKLRLGAVIHRNFSGYYRKHMHQRKKYV